MFLMKNLNNMRSFLIVLIFSLPLNFLTGQVTGMWRTTDHTNDIERSIVVIYERNGRLYGRVETLLPAATVTHCTGCEGAEKNKSLVGMDIIKDLEKRGNSAVNGKILDPETGKYYSCDIELEGPDKLKVRGYLGLYTFGTTMYWKREKNKG